VGIGVLALLVSDILTNALQNVGLDQTGQYKLVIEPLRHSPLWIVLALVAAATLVAPVVEEAFFRGYIFRAIAVRKGLAMAYPISAGAFALNHFFLGGPDILPLVPVLFVIGLMLCFAYRRTGNLLCDITAHALNNGATFALALLPIHLPF
jgi:membrane protease YdiL (CAAX protease family)